MNNNPPQVYQHKSLTRVRLKCGLEVSRIGFGLSRLHHVVWESDRIRLLKAATELGVTHFDTARLYGDGIAERSLGKAMFGIRDRITIASKFGLVPNDNVGRLGSFARPIWVARALARRINLSRWPGRSFSLETMERSLAVSLRLLRTDYLDILFLHEPTIGDLDQNENLLRGLQHAKQAGKVRFIGIAGGEYSKILERFPALFDVIQVPESEWDSTIHIPDITYGILSKQRKELSGSSSSNEKVIGLMRNALQRRASGGVLVSSTKRQNLEIAVSAAEGQ